MTEISKTISRGRAMGAAGILAAGAILLGAPAASATDVTSYAVTSGGLFGRLDLTTGKFTTVGNMGITSPDGLAKIGQTLYTGEGSSIYTIDPSNGALTLVGASEASIDFIGSSSDGLFGMDTSANVYSLSTSTGASTALGPSGLTLSPDDYALSTGFPALYFNNGKKGYVLSPTNGTAIQLGTYAAGVGVGALADIGGIAYGAAISTAADPTSEIYTFNLATDAVSELSTVTGADGQIYGLAAVPEPATWTMMLLGFGAMGALLRRRARSVIA